jgi:hypothetical protein
MRLVVTIRDERMAAFSSIQHAQRHGNSFDHLVGAGEQRRRHVEAGCVRILVRCGWSRYFFAVIIL